MANTCRHFVTEVRNVKTRENKKTEAFQYKPDARALKLHTFLFRRNFSH